jgi:hypothetical protein
MKKSSNKPAKIPADEGPSVLLSFEITAAQFERLKMHYLPRRKVKAGRLTIRRQ